MKPDWKDAPRWANYLAMDESKRWTWFGEEPYKGSSCWLPRGMMQYVEPLSSEWGSTLEEKPKKLEAKDD